WHAFGTPWNRVFWWSCNFLQLRAFSLNWGVQIHWTTSVLQAGANGYISKTCEPSELIEAIREVARGGTYLPAGMIQSLLDAQRKAQPELSRREKEVLTHIAAGLSNTQIARKLHISEKTVSTHKVNLMEKLAITNASDLIRFADNYLLLLDQ